MKDDHAHRKLQKAPYRAELWNLVAYGMGLACRKNLSENKSQNTAEIVSGPYQGRTVRVINIENDDPELYELFKVAA